MSCPMLDVLGTVACAAGPRAAESGVAGVYEAGLIIVFDSLEPLVPAGRRWKKLSPRDCDWDRDGARIMGVGGGGSAPMRMGGGSPFCTGVGARELLADAGTDGGAIRLWSVPAAVVKRLFQTELSMSWAFSTFRRWIGSSIRLTSSSMT